MPIFQSHFVKRVIVLGGAYCIAGTAHADPWFDFSGGVIYDSNVSNGQHSADVKSDSALRATGSLGEAWSTGKLSRFSVTGKLEAERYAHYRDLDRIAPEIGVSWKIKSDLGAQAPWLRFSAAVLHDYAQSDVRSGERYRAGVTLGKQLSADWAASAEYRFDKRVARHGDSDAPDLATDVFSQISHTATLHALYFFNNAAAFDFSYARRDGDVTATTLPYFAVYRVSSAIAEDTAFGDERYAYRLHAVTHLIGGVFSYELDRRSALNVSWQRNLTYGAGDFNYYGSAIGCEYTYRY